MNFSLRHATLSDAATLAVLGAVSFEDTFRGTCTDEDMEGFLAGNYSEEAFRKLLSDAQVYLCLAHDEAGNAAGYAQWKKEIPPFPNDGKKAVELQRLYLLKNYHGLGLAQQLMTAFEEDAARQGAEMLFLGVWEHNYRAQAFYRKQGYAPTGHSHPFPIGNTPQTDDWWWKIPTAFLPPIPSQASGQNSAP